MLEDFYLQTVQARNAVTSLQQYPMEPVHVVPNTLLDAHETSAEKDHDVFGCFYIALARTANADRLLTTDRDFEGICDVRYSSTPIPFPGTSSSSSMV